MPSRAHLVRHDAFDIIFDIDIVDDRNKLTAAPFIPEPAAVPVTPEPSLRPRAARRQRLDAKVAVRAVVIFKEHRARPGPDDGYGVLRACVDMGADVKVQIFLRRIRYFPRCVAAKAYDEGSQLVLDKRGVLGICVRDGFRFLK